MKLNNPSLRKMIEADIDACVNHIGAEGSRELFSSLMIKYSSLDPDFPKNFPNKAFVVGTIPDYSRDLVLIAEKLKMWLMLGEVAPRIDFSQDEYAVENNKIFIIHGRDEAAKEKTARVLAQLDLDPIILHEQPNIGTTIIEKLEQYSDVSYAIVLYTACDLGRLNQDGEKEMPRARQNVVFEHGLFNGKLGRDRVCALCDRKVELPSDLGGLMRINLDEGGAWKMTLCKELSAAGFNVDANHLK